MIYQNKKCSTCLKPYNRIHPVVLQYQMLAAAQSCKVSVLDYQRINEIYEENRPGGSVDEIRETCMEEVDYQLHCNVLNFNIYLRRIVFFYVFFSHVNLPIF
jgi:hypothetical protein